MGFPRKQELVAQLDKAGYEIVDFGASGLDPEDDYPDFLVPLGRAVAGGQVERGVAICRSSSMTRAAPDRSPRRTAAAAPLCCA